MQTSSDLGQHFVQVAAATSAMGQQLLTAPVVWVSPPMVEVKVK